jgi:hypothetical protein
MWKVIAMATRDIGSGIREDHEMCETLRTCNYIQTSFLFLMTCLTVGVAFIAH